MTGGACWSFDLTDTLATTTYNFTSILAEKMYILWWLRGEKMRLQSKDTLWLRKELYSCYLLGWSEWMAISLQQPTMQTFSWVMWVPEFPRVVVHVSKGAAFYSRSLVKMSLFYMTIKSHFYINGFALSLTFKERLGATWKWPIYPTGGLPSLAYAGMCRRTGYGFRGLES